MSPERERLSSIGRGAIASEKVTRVGDTLATTHLKLEIDQRARRRQWLREIQWWSLLAMVVLILLLGILGPILYGRDPLAQDLVARLLPPLGSANDVFYPLGTDALGRDVLARILVGLRISIFVAVMSVAVGVVIGCVLGMLAGYFGGWVDRSIIQFVDAQMSIPLLVFAMVLSAVLGAGIINTIVALGFTGWVVYARVARSETLSRRTLDYVDAARAMGARAPRIMFRHLLPNSMNSLIVIATLEVGHMIITEASLSFLGLGVQPPDPSLGGMVADGQSYVFEAWWLSSIPGAVIFLVVLTFVLFGDVLRDRLDPHMK